jgi:hypothetical protein
LKKSTMPRIYPRTSLSKKNKTLLSRQARRARRSKL